MYLKIINLCWKILDVIKNNHLKSESLFQQSLEKFSYEMSCSGRLCNCVTSVMQLFEM